MGCTYVAEYGDHEFNTENGSQTSATEYKIEYVCNGCDMRMTETYISEDRFDFEKGSESCPTEGNDEHLWHSGIDDSVIEEPGIYVKIREGCLYCDAVRKKEFGFERQTTSN